MPLKSEQLHQSTANNDLAHDVYIQSLQKAQTAVVRKCELITQEDTEPPGQISITFWKPQWEIERIIERESWKTAKNESSSEEDFFHELLNVCIPWLSNSKLSCPKIATHRVRSSLLFCKIHWKPSVESIMESKLNLMAEILQV